MNIQKILKSLKDHANEEVRVHKEVFTDAKTDVKKLVSKHLKDTMSIHRAFWKDLKNAAKSKGSNK